MEITYHKLRQFWESAGETYSLWSADMHLLDFNQHYMRTFHPNLTRENVIGRHVTELSPGIEKTDRYQRYARVLLDKTPAKWQEKIPLPGKEDRHIYINIFPVDDNFGVITTDVTELVNTQKALYTIDNRYRMLYNNTPVMMHSIDRRGLITDVNDYWLDIMGYEREAVIGKGIVEFMTPESRKVAEEISLPNFFKTGITRNREYRIIKKNGEIMDILLSAVGVFDANLEIESSLAFMINITERKQFENDQKSLIRELKAKNAELERFTYSVSHDLKSPLVTIQGFLSMIKMDIEGIATAQTLDDFRRISGAAEKMGQLLDELLDLSRVSRNTFPSAKVDMNLVLSDILALLQGVIIAKNPKMIIQPNLPDVKGDPIRLREVFQNLIENALKYNIEGKEIVIKIGFQPHPDPEKAEEEIVFYVKDNGPGIEARFHKKIFELFEKLDNKQKGTGIGLALCHKIIELHGGSIWVESDGTGTGATFYFSLRKYTPS
ncbi:MAG: PAS domain S-box protein [Bacteroidia bacterium]|nr:PAS domain S-box protein [Bacteroidia bacterium]